MVYEVDLDKVWNLPYCTGRLENDKDSYCAVGKLAVGAGIDIVEGVCGVPDLEESFSDDLNSILVKYGYANYHTYGTVENDNKIHSARTPREKKQAHENACRKLLEICIKEGLIKLKDSDLDIVRELKEVINNDKIGKQTEESKTEERSYSSSSS